MFLLNQFKVSCKLWDLKIPMFCFTYDIITNFLWSFNLVANLNFSKLSRCFRDCVDIMFFKKELRMYKSHKL